MTKVGEGKELPQQPQAAEYHRQVEQNSVKFLNALESYKIADSSERDHLRGIMDQSLAMIRSAVHEIKRSGIYKQEVKVENDYRDYMNSPSTENSATLEEDISTLRDYNKM